MNPLTRLLAILFLLASTFGVNLWVMIEGWGLDVHSWGVLIWGFIIQAIILVLTAATGRDE